jgi:TPR repeat protein
VAAVKALGGDVDAPFGVFLHFSGDHYDRERADYWMEIAAQNGNSNALYSSAVRFLGSNDPCRILRGIYFLELAAKALEAKDPDGAAGVRREITSSRARLKEVPPSNCLRSNATLH